MTGAVALLLLGPVALMVGAAQLAGWPETESRRARLVFGTAFVVVGTTSLGVGLVQALLGWWL